MTIKDCVSALSAGDTGSTTNDAAAGAAANSTDAALHADAYCGQGKPNSQSTGTDRAQSSTPGTHHNWYDGAALMVEGAIDEVVHHPMRVAECAVAGLATGAAVVAGVALLPELAVVAGVAGTAGAAVGGITLLTNAPKWSREMAIVANPDQVDDKTYQAARKDLLAAGGTGADITAGILGGFSSMGVSAIAASEICLGTTVVSEALPAAPELPQLMASVDAAPEVPLLPAPQAELAPIPGQLPDAITETVPVKTDSELIADYFARGNKVKLLPPGDVPDFEFPTYPRGVEISPGGYWIRPTGSSGLGG